MIRTLGKPTLFLTLSSSEYKWPKLLKILYKLRYNKEFKGNPITDMNSNLKSKLINEDPITCNLYFNKLVDVIIDILQSSEYSPFGKYYINDFYKKVEFQHR